MKVWIAPAATLCTVALIAVAAVPASARVPGGQGLVSFGIADCGDFDGEIFGPPAPEGLSGYLIVDDETDMHGVATRFELKSEEGVIFFEKNFGQKAGLTTLTCTQTGDLGDIFTLTVAVVPPKS